MTDETIDIVLHGRHARTGSNRRRRRVGSRFRWTWITEGNWTFGVCPACDETIFVQADHGTIDFGAMQPDLLKENSVKIEFEPLSRRMEP